jgi:NLI interacting factor-like phosphatase
MPWRIRLRTVSLSQVLHFFDIANTFKPLLEQRQNLSSTSLFSVCRQRRHLGWMSASPENRQDSGQSSTAERPPWDKRQKENSQQRLSSNATSNPSVQRPAGARDFSSPELASNLSGLSLQSPQESTRLNEWSEMNHFRGNYQTEGQRDYPNSQNRDEQSARTVNTHYRVTNVVSLNPIYNYPGLQQYQPQYIPPAPSLFWPYDATPMQYNDFNFFTPSFPQPWPGFWSPQQFPQQQYPLPTPSASGTIRIDTPPSTIPTSSIPEFHNPKPTPDYILTTSVPPYRLENPTTKLLILDLNGTLLHRPRHPDKERNMDMRQSSITPVLRPHLAEFLSYIFRNFKIMFWSSAKPHNVNSMIAATLSPEQREQVLAIWARDTLGLSREEYDQKSITIKDLRKVFKSNLGGGSKKKSVGQWDVGNTILLDDSVIKASFQPYNHVCIPEFGGNEEGMQDDALWQVAGYLEELRYQGHVSRFIKQNPFRLGDGWNGTCMSLG